MTINTARTQTPGFHQSNSSDQHEAKGEAGEYRERCLLISRTHSCAPKSHPVLTRCSPVLTHCVDVLQFPYFWLLIVGHSLYFQSLSPLCCTFRIQFEFIFQRSSLPWGKPQSDITVSGWYSSFWSFSCSFHLPHTYCIQIWAQSGHLCAHNPPGASCFTEVRKKTEKDFSFPMTGDSSTWLCLCSLNPTPHGRVFILWSPRTYCWDSKEEIPFLPFFPSWLSYHLPSPSTKSPQQILQHNFPGHHESLLSVSFWELTAILHVSHLSCFSHGSVTEHKAQE